MSHDVCWRLGAVPGDMAKYPHLYFSFESLCEPPPQIEIDYSHAPRGNPSNEGGFCEAIHNGRPCHEACMKGVLVRLLDPPRVWRLTGKADIRLSEDGSNELVGYEAKWPD